MSRPTFLDNEGTTTVVETAPETEGEGTPAQQRAHPARNVFDPPADDAPEGEQEQVETEPEHHSHVQPREGGKFTKETDAVVEPPKVYVREFTDKSGRKTRIEAASESELADKLVDHYKKAADAVVDYRQKYQVFEEGKIVPTFEPKPLSAEDKVRISRKMQDPRTVDEAFSELQKAMTGESPEEYRQRVGQEAHEARMRERFHQVDLFNVAHPDFPPTEEAKKVMVDMFAAKQKAEQDRKNDPKLTIEWNKHNLDIIYEEAIQKGLITPLELTSQEKAPEKDAVVDPPVKADPAKANPETAAEKTRPRGTRRTGLSPNDSSVSAGHQAQASDEKFREEVKGMSKDEIKRRVKNDRVFRQKLDSFKW